MNKYYGPGIRENQYAAQWFKVFEKRQEKNADLLISIVDTDNVDEEDRIIGYQIVALVIMERKLWISDLNMGNMIDVISSNNSYIIEFFDKNETDYVNSWIDIRRKAILALIQRIANYKKITTKPNISLDIHELIERLIAYGDNEEEALTKIFVTLVNVAKGKYKLHLETPLPKDAKDLLDKARAELYEYIGNDIMLGSRISDITQKLWILSNKKKWKIL